MGATTLLDIPVPTSGGARHLLLRAWRSRVTMTAFYLATLAGLLVVSGARLDGFDDRPVGDPITEAAREPTRLSSAIGQSD